MWCGVVKRKLLVLVESTGGRKALRFETFHSAGKYGMISNVKNMIS